MIDSGESIIEQYGDVENYFASCPPPDDEDFAENDGVKGNGRAKQSRQSPKHDEPVNLIFDDAAWIEADIPKRPWLAPGYVLRGAVTILAGVPAGGKSSMAISWATSFVLGRQFATFRPVSPCRVMTYNTEDDGDEQRRRFSAAVRCFGCSIADLTGKIMRVGVERIGTLFGETFTDQGSSLGFGALPALTELEAKIEEFRPDVVFLDPLVELHDQEENDNTQLRLVVALFRTLAKKHNVGIVLLHHVRKGSGAAAGDMDSIRGGGAIVAACRVAFTLTKMSEDDAKGFGIPETDRKHYVRLDEAKANYSETPVDWFEKIVHVLDNGDAAMAFAPWAPPIDIINLETKNSIIAGVERGHSEGPWSTKLDTNARSIRQLFFQHGVTTKDGQISMLNELVTSLGFTTQAFRRVQNRAKAQGLRSKDGLPQNVEWLDDLEGG